MFSILENENILFSTLFDESLDAIVLLDMETQRFVKFNHKTLELYGYSKDEFKQITPKELTAEFLTDEEMQRKQTAIINQSWDQFLTKHKTKNGEVLDIFVKTKKIVFIEKVFLYITLHDITREKYLENKLYEKTKEQEVLLSLFDKGKVYLFKFLDFNFDTTHVSKNIQTLFEYLASDFYERNVNYLDLIYKDDIENFNKEISDIQISNKDFFIHKPYRIVTKNKQIKWLLHQSEILRRSEKSIEILSYLVDITELKEYENNLELLVEEKTKENLEQFKILQQKSKLASMGEMINNIAHQWRQPLAISNTIVSILKEKNSMNILNQEYLEKKLSEFEKNNLYMAKTIDDFLNFFNPKKSKERFAINQVLENSLDIFKDIIEKEFIDISTHIDEKLELYTYKDEYLQVILSILSNSIQAFTNNDKKIQIKAFLDNNKIILQIKDNAGGIPNEIIDRIFEPYFTTKHKSQGTGLGLYISRMIVENSMLGSIMVKNEDEGAVFTIEIESEKIFI